MLGTVPREIPQKIGFVVVPRFSMIGLMSAIEKLRLANRLAGKTL